MSSALTVPSSGSLVSQSSTQVQPQVIEAVQRKLEQQGVIQAMRVQLRAHVLSVLKASSQDPMPRQSIEYIPNISYDKANRGHLLHHTRELLESLGLTKTLAAFEEETRNEYTNDRKAEDKVISTPFQIDTSMSSYKQTPTSNYLDDREKAGEKLKSEFDRPHQATTSPTFPGSTRNDSRDMRSESKDSLPSKHVADDSSISPQSNRSSLTPATTFKPLGSSKAPEPDDSESDEDIAEEDEERPEQDSSHDDGMMSSSFESESQSPSAKIPSNVSNPPPSFSSDARSDSLDSSPKMDAISPTPAPVRATVTSFAGRITRTSINTNANEDLDYDFDDRGPSVSLHSPPNQQNQSQRPLDSLKASSFSDDDDIYDKSTTSKVYPKASTSFAPLRKSNQDEDDDIDSKKVRSIPNDDSEDEIIEEDDDVDEDFDDDYDVSASLDAKPNANPAISKPSNLFQRRDNQIEKDMKSDSLDESNKSLPSINKISSKDSSESDLSKNKDLSPRFSSLNRKESKDAHYGSSLEDDEDIPDRRSPRPKFSMTKDDKDDDEDDDFDYQPSSSLSKRPSNNFNESLSRFDKAKQDDEEDEFDYEPSHQNDGLANKSNDQDNMKAKQPHDDDDEDFYYDPSPEKPKEADKLSSVLRKSNQDEDSEKEEGKKKDERRKNNQLDDSMEQDDYGDDFEDVEEIEEDEMSIGQQDDDESDDDFGGYAPSRPSMRSTNNHDQDQPKSQSLFHSKSGMLPTVSSFKDDDDDDAERKRLAAVEKRMAEMENEDKTGTLAQLAKQTSSSQNPPKKSNQYDDEESLASDNIDEMEFSVGEEHQLSEAESNSDGSDLYSFLDNKPQLSRPKQSNESINNRGTSQSKKPSTTQQSRSSDFSISEHDIDEFESDAYDFTTNAHPPDRRK